MLSRGTVGARIHGRSAGSKPVKPRVIHVAASSALSRPARLSLLRMLASAPAAEAGATSVPMKDDFAVDNRPVILYDGVCNLCNTAVNFMLDVDPSPGNFRLASLQSEAGKRLLQRSGRAPDDISSIVLVEKTGAYIQSEAVLRIARGINHPFAFLAIFGFPVPLFIRDTVYDLVADNRYSIMGKRDECRLADSNFMERFIIE